MQLSNDCVKLEALKGVYLSCNDKRIVWTFIELPAMVAYFHLNPNIFKTQHEVLRRAFGCTERRISSFSFCITIVFLLVIFYSKLLEYQSNKSRNGNYSSVFYLPFSVLLKMKSRC